MRRAEVVQCLRVCSKCEREESHVCRTYCRGDATSDDDGEHGGGEMRKVSPSEIHRHD